MYFCYFAIISPWKRAGPFIWTKLSPLHPKMPCAKFGWNWLSGSGEEDFLILSMYFSYFIIISSWKGHCPSFEQNWIPFTQGCLVLSLVDIGSVVFEKKIFKISSIYFRYFLIISPWKRAGALHLKKLEPPLPKDALCQVWLNLAQWFRRGRFLYFVNVLSLFRNYLPLEKVGALHLNKVESPSLKDSLCKVWLKLAQWFWRRRFFKFRQCIFAILQLSPLGKGQGPSFEQTWFPFTQGCFVQSLVEICPLVLEKKIFFNFVNVLSLFRNFLPLEKGRGLHLYKI